MKIQQVTDKAFAKYGRVVTGIDFSELVEKMQTTPLPENVVYEPSVAQLEALDVCQSLQNVCFGELPIQVGYCNGNNYQLNALEYHRCSEINVAATDMILLLGWQQDVTADHTYDTALVEAFLVPKGVAVELYAATLHYAPCNAHKGGFRAVVVLLKGTNTPLEAAHTGGEDGLMTAKNKWLIGHAEGGLDAGTHIGLTGRNLDVREV